MAVGLRVVRGKDWSFKNKDDGDGHVGTVVKVEQTGRKGSVVVRWDSGKQGNYRAGVDGKYDLRIYDNAPIGVKHITDRVTTICDACKQEGISGFRWMCAECTDYDLCTECYMGDKHETGHNFLLIETPSSAGVEVGSRSTAVRVQARGIFKDAKVERGPNWQWGDQDGRGGLFSRLFSKSESSSVGRVIEIQGWNNEDKRRNNAVKVLWPSGKDNLYRLGYNGQVDLKYVQDAAAGSYYKDHLPLLDVSQGCERYGANDSKLSAGDKVKLCKTVAEMKLLQEGHGGWNQQMENCIGKTGTVLLVIDEQNVAIQIGGSIWNFNAAALTKVGGSSNDNNVSDDESELDAEGVLRAMKLMSMLQRIGSELGESSGTNDSETTETTQKLIVAAAQGQKAVVLEILQATPEEANRKFRGKTALQLASHEGYTDIVNIILSHNADPNLQDDEGDTAVHCAVFGNRPEVLELLLSKGAKANVRNKNKVSPLHIAVNKQCTECVALLLRHNCDVNIQNSEGDTPLHDAIQKDSTDMIQVLINASNMDVTTRNYKGFNALHFAALKGNKFAVELLLEKASHVVNWKRDDGHAAIHIAAVNGYADVIETLICKGQCEMDIKNHKELTPLMLAVHEGHCSAMAVLVQKGADVNAEDADGDTALHLALVFVASDKKPEQKDDYPEVIETILQDFSRRQVQRNVFFAISCYLAQENADIQHRNNHGKSVLDYIDDNEQVKILKEYASKTKSAVQNPTANDAQDDNAKECLICNELPATIKFQPCNHQIACEDCSLRMKKCITCQQVIMAKISTSGKVVVDKPKVESIERLQYLESKIQEIEQTQNCPVCMDTKRDVIFLCGHGVCTKCGRSLEECPVCRKPIEKKIDLY